MSAHQLKRGTMKDIIFVDVDGVLFPITENPPKGYESFMITPYKEVIVNPAHGKWLLDLAAETDSELVWCTFWEDKANEYIAPLVGLPELPVAKIIPWKMYSSPGSWKAWTAKHYADKRRWVQFDDEGDVGYWLNQFEVPGRQGKHIKVGPTMGLSINNIRNAKNFLLN